MTLLRTADGRLIDPVAKTVYDPTTGLFARVEPPSGRVYLCQACLQRVETIVYDWVTGTGDTRLGIYLPGLPSTVIRMAMAFCHRCHAQYVHWGKICACLPYERVRPPPPRVSANGAGPHGGEKMEGNRV